MAPRVGGQWQARDDVYVVGPSSRAELSWPNIAQLRPGRHGAWGGGGPNGGTIGPELSLGYALGEHVSGAACLECVLSAVLV